MLRRLWAKYMLWKIEVCSIHFTKKTTGYFENLYCRECRLDKNIRDRQTFENEVERATRILKGEI